jgi:hypothetical protein
MRLDGAPYRLDLPRKKASPRHVKEFRTGWFVESVISASIIALVVRSRRPFTRCGLWRERGTVRTSKARHAVNAQELEEVLDRPGRMPDREDG